MRGLGRGGRGRFPPAEIAEVKALACELPAQTGRPLSRWSAAELAREAVAARDRLRGLGDDGLALAERGRDPAVGVALVGVPARPGLPREGRPGARSLRAPLGGSARHPGRPRDLVFMQKTQLQAALLRSPPARRAGSWTARSWSNTSTGGAGRRPTWPRSTSTIPQRGLFGHCVAKISNDAFDALVADVMTCRALCLRAAGVLGRRHRHHPPRPEVDRLASRCLAEPRARAPAPPRVVAEPDRDLLLDRATQGAHTVHTSPRRSSPRPPHRLTGPSPAVTSTPCSTASISAAGSHRPPERTSRRRYEAGGQNPPSARPPLHADRAGLRGALRRRMRRVRADLWGILQTTSRPAPAWSLATCCIRIRFSRRPRRSSRSACRAAGARSAPSSSPSGVAVAS